VVRAIVSSVLLTKVVVRVVPLKLTVEVLKKPVPLIVRVCAAAPTATELGEREVIAGTGFPTAKFTGLDAPPPGAGFVTVTAYVPAVPVSVVVRAIVSSVLLTKVVVRVVPLKLTVEVFTKPVPLIVRGCAPEPTVPEVGKREVIAGTGFVTVKLMALDVPPPGAGFVAETGNVAPVATSALVRETISWVLLTKTGVRLEPLKLTVEVFTKPVPLIVRVCAPEPAATEAGEREVMAGTGFVTVKFTALDAPPPGAGFVTETGKVPPVATSALLRESFSWVLLTKVGVRLDPLKLTVEALVKPLPVTVRVVSKVPTRTLVGETEDKLGAG
jgi:hypothetical protein